MLHEASLLNIDSYILFKSPELWTPTRANDIRSCSATLFAAAERNNAVRKYCDVLESIINATMDHVEQVLSPEQSLTVASTVNSSVCTESWPESPAESFNKLKVTLKELQFEFPSQSYPAYRSEPTTTKNSSVGAQADTMLDTEVRGGFLPPFAIDFNIPEAQWNLMGPFSDIVDMDSNGNVFTMDHFT